MYFIIILSIAGLVGFGFWRLTRYFWLKIFYRWKGVKDMDVQSARELQSKLGAFVLDVREPQEYEEAHVDGVTLIPLGQLALRANEIESQRGSQLLIICRGGVRSAKACLILAELGFKHPINVAGGMNDWKRNQLPVVWKNDLIVKMPDT